MALEFHILTGNGDNFKDYSKEVVAFEESEYVYLINLASSCQVSIFSSMQNYYGEYKFLPVEVGHLIEEISTITSHISNNGSLKIKLDKLSQLCSLAKLKNLPIITFPD